MRSILAFTLLAATSLLAQTDRANLTGTVTDPSGARVSHATVSALAVETQITRATQTNSAGIYLIPELPIGEYVVTITSAGFHNAKFENVKLYVGQTLTQDAQLEIGGPETSVEVTAPAAAMNRTSGEISGVVETKQIEDVPISGRNWASLTLLAPGAVNYGDGAQRSIRFAGHSLDDGNFVFDGIDTTGVQEQTQKADTRLNIALDSIAQFQVKTGVYTAESGGAGGAQVEVVSKSGTNDYHGSAFYAVRNVALDSRSPFDGPSLPDFTLNQFGASFGGAIVKDKMFYYFNYEGLRQSLGQTFINFVPNAAFRAQVIAQSPALAPIVNAYPMGQTHIDSQTDQVTLVASDTIREDAGMARFDYLISGKDSMYVRYNIDNAYIDTPTDALGDRNVIPHVPTNVVFESQHIFDPATLNEAKFGINRANYHNYSYGTAPLSVSPGPFDGLSGNSLDTEVGTTFNYLDNFTAVRGKHTLKAGVEIRRIRLNNSGNTWTTSSISYATAQDFIDNSAASATYLQGEGVVGNRRTFYMGYVQDEFRPLPNLTLNLGMRYEYYSVAHEILNRSAVVDVLGCGGFCPKGTPYYSPNTHDFGPRLGLAWAPKALHGKTNIRSGFGIYYGGNQNDDFSDPAESAVPRYSLAQSDFPALSYPLVAFLNPANQLYSPKAIDRHRKDLYYENWDFLIQQQLPDNFILQAGYVGSEGHHLFDKYTVNLINPLTGTRPLSQFSSFGLKSNNSNDNFSALQVNLQRRFFRGLLVQANYQYGHEIGDGSIGSGESVGFQNMSCRACDRSDTSIDVRHNFVASGVYELPFGKGKQLLKSGWASRTFGGWELATLASARTGLPINITITRKAAALPDGNTSSQRPNFVSGQPIYPANQTINNWLNIAAYSTPANGVWGNLGRYSAFGPGAFEIDQSLQKRFMVTERLALNFRASAFNLLNHPEFKNPGSNVSSSSFGRITGILNTGATGSGAPRRIEFMFRAEF